MNTALEGLNPVIHYFSNSGFREGIPYSNSRAVGEAPVLGKGTGSRNGKWFHQLPS